MNCKNYKYIRGESGINGRDGIQGNDGPIGPKGDKGTRGPRGGERGLKGDKGDKGCKGIVGCKGNIGDKAPKGEKGHPGFVGIQGLRGIQGLQGIQGFQGLLGITGDKGETGGQGVRGITGDNGLTGDKGQTGGQGVRGIIGLDGQKGNSGEKGVEGDKGGIGLNGLSGSKGNKGDSLTELAIYQRTANFTSAPYIWGSKGLEYINTLDNYNVGTFKQIRSAFFLNNNVNNIIAFSPPNNIIRDTTNFSLEPPCQSGGELLEIGTPVIWDIPSSNYNSTYNTFTIPNKVSRTLMTISLHIDVFYPNLNSADLVSTPVYIDRNYMCEWWLGKGLSGTSGSGNGPMAYRLGIIKFNTTNTSLLGNSSQPTIAYDFKLTLLGGNSTKNIDFVSGDTFYITAHASGTNGLWAKIKQFRLKITWEAID